MIAVDASAILAILLAEDEGAAFRTIIAAKGGVVSPVNHWEVLARAHSDALAPGAARAEALIQALGLKIADLTVEDSRRAYQAFARFGKGQGGPLNLGDCFAYALAQAQGDGLLFKGDDFPKTDVKAALA